MTDTITREEQRDRVLALARIMGPYGVTVKQVAHHFNPNDESAVNRWGPRMMECRDDDRLVALTEKRDGGCFVNVLPEYVQGRPVQGRKYHHCPCCRHKTEEA